MKTPWSNLLQYGVGIATIIVLCLAGILLLAVVGIAVIASKFLVFIR